MARQITGASVEEIVDVLALDFAENERNPEKNKEELVNEYSETIMQKISAIYNSLQDQFPGVELPKGMMLDIAQTVAEQVQVNGIKSPEHIHVGQDISNRALEKALDNSDKTITQLHEEVRSIRLENTINAMMAEKTVQTQNEYAQKIISEYNNNRDNPKFIEPEDPRYCFRDENDENDERIIEDQKVKATHLMADLVNHPERIVEIQNIMENNPNGLGIDAVLRSIEEDLSYSSHYGDVTVEDTVPKLINSPERMQVLRNLIHEMQTNEAFIDDKFTAARKMSIFTSILRYGKEHHIPAKLMGEIKSMDSELYSLVSENLEQCIAMQDSDFSEKRMAFDKVIFANDSYEKETFVENFTAVLSQSKIQGLDNAEPNNRIGIWLNKRREALGSIFARVFGNGPKKLPEPEQEILQSTETENIESAEPVSKPKTVSTSEKYENIKRALEGLFKAKGSKGISNFTTINIESQKDADMKKLFMHAGLETLENHKQELDMNNPEDILARKKIFETIVENNLEDDNTLKRMVQIDRQAASQLLSQYGDVSNPRSAKLIVDLEKAMGEEKAVATKTNAVAILKEQAETPNLEDPNDEVR